MNDYFKSIKIRQEVKNRLDFFKKKLTYSECLDQMLTYFELTGIDPRLGQTPPIVTFVATLKETSSALYKRIEDMIKIMRNVETNKIDPILHTVDNILAGKSNNTPEVVIGAEEEQMYQLIALNKQLEKELENKENIIQNFKLKFSDGAQNAKIQDIIYTLEELLSERNLPNDKAGNIILTLDYKKRLIEKIKTIANV